MGNSVHTIPGAREGLSISGGFQLGQSELSNSKLAPHVWRNAMRNVSKCRSYSAAVQLAHDLQSVHNDQFSAQRIRQRNSRLQCLYDRLSRNYSNDYGVELWKRRSLMQ